MARDVYATAEKLKRLAESPNPHEAARAREKYRDYATRHQLAAGLPPQWAEVLRVAEEQQQAIHDCLAEMERMRAARVPVDDILARHGARLVPRRERRRKEP